MKKLVFVAVASLAIAAVAYTPQQVGVTTFTPTTQNAIVPVAFKSLSDGTTAVSAKDLVKTTNLDADTWLIAVNGSQYSSWKLQGGAWIPAIYSSPLVQSITAGASEATLTAGSAIWIVFPSTPKSVTIYGAPASGVTSSIAANAATLVGNPLQTAATISVTPVAGDAIVIPTSDSSASRYVYRTNKAGTVSGWRLDGAAATLPAIGVGQGFWYVRNGDATTLSWVGQNQ